MKPSSISGGPSRSSASAVRKKRKQSTNDGILSSHGPSANAAPPSSSYGYPPFMQQQGVSTNGMMSQFISQHPMWPYHSQLQQQQMQQAMHHQQSLTPPPAPPAAAAAAANSHLPTISASTSSDTQEPPSASNSPLDGSMLQQSIGPHACDWVNCGFCTMSWDENAIDICQAKGCTNKVHHPCMIHWESSDQGTEGSSCSSFCTKHHKEYQLYIQSQQKNKNNKADEFGSGEDDEEVDEDDNEDLEGEMLALKYTGKSVRQYYQKSLRESKKQYDLPLLLTMATGELTLEEKQADLMNEFVSKAWLAKKEIKTTNALLKREITRRFEIESEVNDDDEPTNKSPALSGTSATLEKRLSRASDDNSRVYPLKYDSEKKWLIKKIERTLHTIRKLEEEKEDEKMRNGDHLRNETYLKMRLVHAFLKGDRRNKLLRLFDAMKRKQLDARNSADKEDDIFQEIADDWNNAGWAPTSIQFPHLHRKFAVGIDLSLPETAVTLTADAAEKIMKDLISKYMKAFEGWQGSGNGKEGQAKEGEKIRLLVRGTKYEPTEHDDHETLITYVDDDRFKFCGDSIAVAYFWGYLELIDLTTFVVQNAKKIGLVSGRDVSSARGGVGGKKSRRHQNEESLQDALKELPAMMKETFVSMMHIGQDEKKLAQYEDQYRKACALMMSIQSDHHDALLAFTMYKSQTTDPSEDVMKCHKLICDRKYDCYCEARSDAREWDRRRTVLRNKLEGCKQNESSDTDDHGSEGGGNSDDGAGNEADEENDGDESNKEIDESGEESVPSDEESVPSDEESVSLLKHTSLDYGKDPSNAAIGKITDGIDKNDDDSFSSGEHLSQQKW